MIAEYVQFRPAHLLWGCDRMLRRHDPILRRCAEGMNKADKIVFSMTLKKAEWNNTRLVRDNMVEEVKKMKQMPGKDLTILGSGSIVTQLAQAGLIDEYQLMVDPVALGAGTSLFHSMRYPLNLKLASSRIFKSGTVLLNYVPLEK
jgi:dihydrofolate reductase